MVFNPNSEESCAYYGQLYQGRPARGADYYANQSRDYALSSTVKCKCTSCLVNKNGYCEVPSLIEIDAGGKCMTGQKCIDAGKKR